MSDVLPDKDMEMKLIVGSNYIDNAYRYFPIDAVFESWKAILGQKIRIEGHIEGQALVAMTVKRVYIEGDNVVVELSGKEDPREKYFSNGYEFTLSNDHIGKLVYSQDNMLCLLLDMNINKIICSCENIPEERETLVNLLAKYRL